MAQYENRLSYEDKKKELVTYIFDCINDTMQENFGLRYRTVTKAEAIALEGNKSILEAQLYYNEDLRVLYLYYVMDKNCRWGRPVDCNKMYTLIDKKIKDNIFKDEAVDIEFMGVSKRFDGEIHECSADITSILSAMVFTWWSWDGLENFRNEFIMDKRFVMLKYRGNEDKLPEFVKQTEEINSRYSLRTHPEQFEDAFEEYKQLFYDTFGVEIECATPNVEHMYLLNETDYSIFE